MGRSHSKNSKANHLDDKENRYGNGSKSDSEVNKTKKEQEKQLKKLKQKNSKLSKLKVPNSPTLYNRANTPNFDYDIEAKKRMQDQLALNSEMFVLNQMMLSVQFFANYERDLYESVELNRKRENFKSAQLIKHCKTVVLPDRLHEAVDRRVKYYARHGPIKNMLLPLHNQTMYVVHDNIEITNPGESSVYCILSDAPIYKLQIDDPYESTTRKKKVLHHVGYVKLKSSEKITKTDVISYNLSSDSQYVSDMVRNDEDVGEADDEEDVPINNAFQRYKGRDSLKFIKNKEKDRESTYETRKFAEYTSTGVPLSTTSTNSTSPPSSEYDYTYITALHTHQPLAGARNGNFYDQNLSTVVLPDSCISNVSRFLLNNKNMEQFYNNNVYSSDDDSDRNNHDDEDSDPAEQYYYEDKQYLNSKQFLCYFINTLEQTMATDLGITKEKLATATWKGAAIYCDPWEIIPAISCPWPKEANEWVYRPREVKENPKTLQKYQWPTLDMVNKVISLGCHVIPQGFAPKCGVNPQRELEWKIVFPEADRYLEGRLTSAQAKIYMVTKSLIKTFVEPNLERGFNMLTSEHIRSHLFWQCEINYAAWPEDYLGEALIRFLNALLGCIKTHRLPDYYMPKRNLFENIPEKVLVEIHKRIFRIVENPVTHLMIAIRNMRYQKNFYPKLKQKRLYSRLVIEDPLDIISPNIKVDISHLLHAESDEDDNEAPLGTIAYYEKKEKQSRKRRTRTVRFTLDENYVSTALKKNSKSSDIMRKVSVESIDTKYVFLKHMAMLRRKLIYDIFVEHYIEMAKTSQQFLAFHQGLIYLKQAERVCLLLKDDMYEEIAEETLKTIWPIKQELLNSIENLAKGPELPIRVNSIEEDKLERLRIRYRPQKRITMDDQEIYSLASQTRASEQFPDISSDDDNDEIDRYNKNNTTVDIHKYSADNLNRFDQDADEDEYGLAKIAVPMRNVKI